jgi:uncharacterized membrane protein YkvA (DUF1232 family)
MLCFYHKAFTGDKNMIRAILAQIELTWRLLRDPRVPTLTKAIPVGAILYVLSPFDLIPDFFIGIGQIDDIGLLIGAMRLFESACPEDVVNELKDEIKAKHDDTSVYS